MLLDVHQRPIDAHLPRVGSITKRRNARVYPAIGGSSGASGMSPVSPARTARRPATIT